MCVFPLFCVTKIIFNCEHCRSRFHRDSCFFFFLSTKPLVSCVLSNRVKERDQFFALCNISFFVFHTSLLFTELLHEIQHCILYLSLWHILKDTMRPQYLELSLRQFWRRFASFSEASFSFTSGELWETESSNKVFF